MRAIRFALSDKPITAAGLSEVLPPEVLDVSRSAGATVEFSGIVRDHNDGKRVSALEYSAYAELAVKEGERIVLEALEKFEALGAVCVHRTGALALGDIAVIVRVWAAHRGPAFAACSWIIDEVKSRVPIWKHEAYTGHDPAWVDPVSQGSGRV
jgi:molybdopterin synthase catalytic subunit